MVGIPVGIRRILSRPWASDPYLAGILDEFIEKAKSITKQITYSPVIKDMYVANRSKCVEHVELSSRIRDFAYAPHRYNSEAKVLLRIALTLDAVLTTCCQVISLRGASTPEGSACLQTMMRVDDEMLLQLGMVADASLELDAFVRTCDKSDLDESELPQLIDKCETTLTRLFVDGQCLHVPGLTSVMLKTVRRPRTYVLNGIMKTIGNEQGPGEEVTARCLRRMAAWVLLATGVIAAEFPD